MADMNKDSKKTAQRKFAFGLMVLFLCVSVMPFIGACEKESPTSAEKVVLRSSVPGRWYTDNAEILSKQITALFQQVKVEPISDVIALILPHAGYQYSGQTAASAIKSIGKEYKRVVIIGPSHGVPMEEVLSVPRATHYQTPLGQVPLDVEFINKLLDYPMFVNVPRVHLDEHSVQIELPLLQYQLKDFKLVPIVAGQCSLRTITKAGAVLKSMADSETLVIASSDFVHYGRGYRYVPFTENVPEQIKKLDMGAYEHIAKSDPKGLLEYTRKTGATICGYIPIATLLSTLDKPTEVRLVKYTTSGQLTGDFSNSVSYLSIAFSGTWGNHPQIEPQASSSELTEMDKKQLLTLARKSLLYALEHRRIPRESDLDVVISDAMRQPRAAFVTLKKSVAKQQNVSESGGKKPAEKNYQLRGCIGDIFPQRPLYRSVIMNAINAGFNDRRFPQVTKAECNDITIEISALTAPRPIASPKEIRIGIDGVVLNKDGRSAVFLPQVAPEQSWNVEQMLTRLSLKANLSADAWKEGTSFLVFQAVVFSEEEK